MVCLCFSSVRLTDVGNNLDSQCHFLMTAVPQIPVVLCKITILLLGIKLCSTKKWCHLLLKSASTTYKSTYHEITFRFHDSATPMKVL